MARNRPRGSAPARPCRWRRSACGGRPTVTSGSRIAVRGIMRGWKMIFLVWVASSVITPARPTSLPVPAVVGIATIGRDRRRRRPGVHQSPTSSKSHKGRLWPAMNATTLPQSRALPPPSATTPSWLARPEAPARRPRHWRATGFERTSVNRPASRPPRAGSPGVRRSPAARRARVGHHQRPGDARLVAGPRHLGEAARPIDHGRG